MELGLQTMHEDTARDTRRGYPLPVFEDAVNRLRAAGLEAVSYTHLDVYKRQGLSPQCIKYTLGNGRCTSVGTVKSYTHGLEGTCGQGDQITDLY